MYYLFLLCIIYIAEQLFNYMLYIYDNNKLLLLLFLKNNNETYLMIFFISFLFVCFLNGDMNLILNTNSNLHSQCSIVRFEM